MILWSLTVVETGWRWKAKAPLWSDHRPKKSWQFADQKQPFHSNELHTLRTTNANVQMPNGKCISYYYSSFYDFFKRLITWYDFYSFEKCVLSFHPTFAMSLKLASLRLVGNMKFLRNGKILFLNERKKYFFPDTISSVKYIYCIAISL